MRGIVKAVVILSALVVLTGCGIYEEQKNTAIQTVTAAFFSPFVDAQRTTPLTQGAFKKPTTVAPQKTTEQKVENVVKPQVVEPMKEPVSEHTCETRRERRERRG